MISPLRPYAPADLAAVADLMTRAYVAFGIDTVITPDFVTMRVNTPGMVMRVLPDADGALIAGYSASFADGIGWGELYLLPEYLDPAIIHALIAHMEAWVGTLASDAPRGLRIYTTRMPIAEPVLRVFAERGYAYIRSHYRMEITLGAPVEPAAPPPGITIRPFDRARDAFATYEAHEDAFAEHFGFVHETYETWEQRVLNYAGDDNSLWLIAWDGDHIAGYSLSRPARPETMWVGNLGVRPAYRRRGLGKALLLRSFQLAVERGFTRVALGVDASNATGAVHLYESAGMRVYLEFVNYAKPLP